MNRNAHHTLHHPKWYRVQKPIFWWVKRFADIRFIFRELTSLAGAYSVILLVVIYRALLTSEAAYTSLTTTLREPFWVNFRVHFGVIFGSVPGSLLGSALEHLLHRNISKTKRFWCFGGFGKGLISGHVPAPFQGTFLVIILVRFGGNFLTASLGLATFGPPFKLGFELSQ